MSDISTILQRFCSLDETRYKLAAPHYDADRDCTVATDGSRMICIHGKHSEAVAGYPAWHTTMAKFQWPDAAEFRPLTPEMLPARKSAIVKYVECPACQNFGYVDLEDEAGEQYECECRSCKGTGYLDEEAAARFQAPHLLKGLPKEEVEQDDTEIVRLPGLPENMAVRGDWLHDIAELPGCAFCVSRDDSHMTLFIASGGIRGIIMPVIIKQADCPVAMLKEATHV